MQLIPAQSWEDPLPIPEGVDPDQAVISSDWYRSLCHPIVKAMYKRDWNAASRLHQEAMCLDLGGMSKNDRECIRLQLMYLEFQMHIGMRRLERISKILPIIDEVFRTAKSDPITDFLRRKRRLEINLCLDLIGIRAADSDDIERLAYNDTSRHWPFDVWIMLSYWAFIHLNEDLLLHANNRMITMCEDNKIYAWYIQRNLVLQMLLTGEATADDLLWLIDTVELITQLESVGSKIRKKSDELGIWTDKVANAYRTMKDTMSRTNNTAVDVYFQKARQTTVAS